MRAALAELETAVATRIGRLVVRTLARKLRDALYAAAPHRPGVQFKVYTAKSGTVVRRDYGDLRDNIKVKAVRAKKQGHIVYEVTTGFAFWANFLEFGTRRMRARPWFRPAFERLAPTLLAEMGPLLWAEIEKQLKKRGRGIGHNGGPPLTERD